MRRASVTPHPTNDYARGLRTMPEAPCTTPGHDNMRERPHSRRMPRMPTLPDAHQCIAKTRKHCRTHLGQDNSSIESGVIAPMCKRPSEGGDTHGRDHLPLSVHTQHLICLVKVHELHLQAGSTALH
jgi:hypothetical protein